MKRIAALSVVYLLLAAPASLLAKSPTLKIVIQGADLTTPIQISDAQVLANFQVLSGKGTYTNEPRIEEPSFIIDWSQGPTAEPPQALSRYQILFYAERPNERLVYAVSYAFDAVTREGYVYLPGKNDEDYALNVHTIIRRVEGKWFHSWAKWDSVAQQLIQSHKREQSSTTAKRIEPWQPAEELSHETQLDLRRLKPPNSKQNGYRSAESAAPPKIDSLTDFFRSLLVAENGYYVNRVSPTA